VAKSVLVAKALGGPKELSKGQIRALDKLAGR
jgi:hypothetical protein